MKDALLILYSKLRATQRNNKQKMISEHRQNGRGRIKTFQLSSGITASSVLIQGFLGVKIWLLK